MPCRPSLHRLIGTLLGAVALALVGSAPAQESAADPTTGTLALEIRLGVTAVIDEVLEGDALAEANRAIGLADDEQPRLMIWAADIPNRFGQRDIELVSIAPEPTETAIDPENGNRIFLWDLTPDLATSATLRIERVYRLVSGAYDAPELRADGAQDAAMAAFYTKSERFQEITPELAAAATAAVGDATDQDEKARRLFRFVRSHMTYEYPPPGGRGAIVAFEQAKGDCGQYADLFVALARSQGLPARMAAGFGLSEPKAAPGEFVVGSHAWAELLRPDGEWIPVDPTRDEEFYFGRKRDGMHITVSVGRNIPLPRVPAGATYAFSEVEDGRTDLMQAFTEYRSGLKARVAGQRAARLLDAP